MELRSVPDAEGPHVATRKEELEWLAKHESLTAGLTPALRMPAAPEVGHSVSESRIQLLFAKYLGFLNILNYVNNRKSTDQTIGVRTLMMEVKIINENKCI